jgi:hypothetical protein
MLKRVLFSAKIVTAHGFTGNAIGVIKNEKTFGVFHNSIYLCDIKQSNPMKTLSLKLDDSVFNETEQVINHIKKSRNRYINEALDFYNKVQKRKLLASKLEKESKLVKDESLTVLHEFELIDYEG